MLSTRKCAYIWPGSRCGAKRRQNNDQRICWDTRWVSSVSTKYSEVSFHCFHAWSEFSFGSCRVHASRDVERREVRHFGRLLHSGSDTVWVHGCQEPIQKQGGKGPPPFIKPLRNKWEDELRWIKNVCLLFRLNVRRWKSVCWRGWWPIRTISVSMRSRSVKGCWPERSIRGWVLRMNAVMRSERTHFSMTSTGGNWMQVPSVFYCLLPCSGYNFYNLK